LNKYFIADPYCGKSTLWYVHCIVLKYCNETVLYVCGGCWKRNERVLDNINVLFDFGVQKKIHLAVCSGSAVILFSSSFCQRGSDETSAHLWTEQIITYLLF